MHNVPFGSSGGLNLIFGGGTVLSETQELYLLPTELHDFKHIYIYDPTRKTFHSQTATGTPPTPRARFCSVGTPGSKGTYEIFIYAGVDPSLSVQQTVSSGDEVFVLSLPGFVWFKADLPAIRTRVQHTCDIVGQGGSQMVVMGGINPNSGINVTDATPDPWTNGINVFDLSAMRWKDEYEAKRHTVSNPVHGERLVHEERSLCIVG